MHVSYYFLFKPTIAAFLKKYITFYFIKEKRKNNYYSEIILLKYQLSTISHQFPRTVLVSSYYALPLVACKLYQHFAIHNSCTYERLV